MNRRVIPGSNFTMQFHFKIHQGRDGIWADYIELKGCRTQADTREELAANAKEALDLFLNESSVADPGAH